MLSVLNGPKLCGAPPTHRVRVPVTNGRLDEATLCHVRCPFMIPTSAGVAVLVDVLVGAGVSVSIAVFVGTGVTVLVGVSVGTAVGVSVLVGGMDVAVAVAVAVGGRIHTPYRSTNVEAPAKPTAQTSLPGRAATPAS